MAEDKQLKEKLKYRKKLTKITNLINSASDVKEILVDLKDRILELIDAERISIFALDSENQQLFTMFKVGDEIKEIRVPKNFSSITGFTALSKQTLNIGDVYDKSELNEIHPKVSFDKSWDKSSGFRTEQMLATPVMYDKYLMGVLEVINKKTGSRFTKEEEEIIEEVAKVLGIAIYNQRRASKTKKSGKFSLLIEKGLITKDKLEEAVSHARMNNRDIGSVLMEKHKIPKDEIGESLGDFYNCEFFHYDGSQTVPEEFREAANYDFLEKMNCAPLKREKGKLYVAIDDPYDLSKVDSIKTLNIAPRCEFLVGLKKDIRECLRKSYNIQKEEEDEGELGEILDELEVMQEEALREEEKEPEPEVDEEDSGIVRLANKIIMDAYRQGASDIHIEPYEKEKTEIRFRIDGVCHHYQTIPASHRNALISRFKIMAQLDIAEKRKPQDGKITFRTPEGVIELRVAVVPTVGGEEDIVMRILASSKPMKLEAMGMNDRNLEIFKESVTKPYGIFLCVGPTGSGKTTTLHSALGYINDEERKIWTAEDPVEITQHGLRQVQVKSQIGFDFARAMRAFLRADPDVIMVGEMRDEETASIGIEASLTGHLVFSTLHTNSAPETVTRLLDMNIDPLSFADALLGILAQRLVRTLCKNCKEEYHPDREHYERLVEAYGGRETFMENLDIEYDRDLTLYRSAGCSECNDTGYSGRMAIHELLNSSQKMSELIGSKARVEEIKQQAIKEGMTTLMQDGIWKVFEGYTDFKQVRAVCME